MATTAKPMTILLVEDNEDHVILTSHALRENGVANDIRVASTGEQALDYLFRRGEFSDPETSPRPGLILLDLKLPGLDGIDVLKAIKDDPGLRLVPVVMLTSSAAETDVVASYASGVNSYIQKPVDFAQFADTIKRLKMYWVVVNRPPPANE